MIIKDGISRKGKGVNTVHSKRWNFLKRNGDSGAGVMHIIAWELHFLKKFL